MEGLDFPALQKGNGMKNEKYRDEVSRAFDRLFDVKDTYNNCDFYEDVDNLTEAYYVNREENEDVSNFVEEMADLIMDVRNKIMTESQFVVSAYELYKNGEW